MRQKPNQLPTANQAAKPNRPGTRQKISTFADHIAELRRRFMLIAVVFVAASALAYTYHEALVHLIMSPLKGQKLVYLTPGGGFSFIFQVSLYAGLIVSAPFIVHHIYAFIKPALPRRAQRSAGKVVMTALFLIIMGIAYGYFVAVPAALHFLSGFAGDSVTPNLTADSYLSFFLSYIAGLALLSLLPLFLIFWHWVKPMSPGGLLKSERWVILLAFVAAALITPTPDAANQTMIAGPVILLYQGGVIAVMTSIARSKRAQRRAAKQQTSNVVPESQLDEVLAELEKPATSTPIANIPQPNVPAAASTPTRTYLDVAAPVARPQAALQKQPAPIGPARHRSMDIMPRHTPSSRPRPSQMSGYTARPRRPEQLNQRPRLNLDGVFAPMQAA